MFDKEKIVAFDDPDLVLGHQTITAFEVTQTRYAREKDMQILFQFITVQLGLVFRFLAIISIVMLKI